MNSMYQQLMQLPLFQGVGTEKITALVEKLPFHFLKYRNGEQIFAAGDPCTHIKFIVSGQVRLETPFPNLRITMHQTIHNPHVLAAECLFGRETVYPYTAVSHGACGILQLLKSDYIKMVTTEDALSISGATDIGFRYKQKDLCTLLGTQRTTLVSTLDKLRDLDILDYDSNGLTILDFQGLLNLNDD